MTSQDRPFSRVRRVPLLFAAAAAGLVFSNAFLKPALGQSGNSAPKPAASQPVRTKEESQTAARRLLREIDEKPGFYSQMCGIPQIKSDQFSPYAFTRFEERVSAESFARLRNLRADVIELIRLELVGLHTAMKTKTLTTQRTEDAIEVNANHLAILIDLNGVEALDALCVLAADLAMPQLPTATSRPARELSTEIWPGAEVRFGFNSPAIADALSTITAILRQEECRALMDSDIEKNYCRAVHSMIKPAAQTPEGKPTDAAKAPEQAPSPWECWDKHCKVRTSFDTYCWVELTPQRRDQILGWARDYLKSTPPEKRKAAAGMSPWPITR